MGNDIIKVSRNTVNAPKNPASTQTVAFSHYNNISAQLAIDPKSGTLVGKGIREQTEQCLKNIKAIVESIDHTMDDVVKVNLFLRKSSDLDAVDEVYKTFFQSYLPARTTVAVAALPLDGALVQIDAILSNAEGTPPQDPLKLVKVARNTENAPKGLSTQTVAFSHYNNISAQLPIDPKSGKVVTGGIKEQTEQCLNNIKAILESIDHVLDDVVKTTIFLKNIKDMDAVNEIYSNFFPSYLPARTIVQASGIPMEALVHIDTVVSHGDGTPPQLAEDARFLVIEANNTENAPKNPLSTQTVAYSHYNHISAQIPVDPSTNKIVAGGVKEQAGQCLNNIKTILESIDHVMDDIVKVNIQLKNIKDLDTVNEVYTTFFKEDLPARTVIGVSAIPKDALVQIDAVVSNSEGTPA